MQEKNKLSRRRFLLVTGATGLTLGLAACVPAAPAVPAADTGSGAAEPAAEPITLIFNMRAGGDQSEPAIYVRRPAKFIEEHPNVKIELAPIPGGEYDAKILTSASAGTIGDIIFTSDVWTLHTRLVKLGVIAAVDDYQQAHGISKEEWLPAAVDTLTHDGKMYGMPKSSHPGEAYIWLNNTLFEEAGIPLPASPYGVTHEEITAWAEALTKGSEDDREVYGIMIQAAGIQAIVNGVRQFGAYENNEEGTENLADNEEWMAWASWVKNFYDKKLTAVEASLPSGGADALFLAGRLGMRHNQRYFYRRSREGMKEVEKPFEMTIIQAPRKPNAKGWVASVDTHSATTSTKHPEEAFALSYALADQTFTRYVAEDQGYLTARVDDIETVKDITYPFLELQYQCMTEEEKFHQPANARGLEVQTVYVNELGKLWLGEADLTPAFMQNLKDAVDEILDKPF
ncbi:MAG: extracellular solute-binding protein [Caldilinea sp. CFX5]|nr:extracellular solute-binding protein [Caldilinea sp. CFX5]